MQDVLSNAVFRNLRLSFTAQDLLPPKDAKEIRGDLRQARSLQFSMVHRLLLGDAPAAAGRTEAAAIRRPERRTAN
jgi:hypothetical protein